MRITNLTIEPEDNHHGGATIQIVAGEEAGELDLRLLEYSPHAHEEDRDILDEDTYAPCLADNEDAMWELGTKIAGWIYDEPYPAAKVSEIIDLLSLVSIHNTK